MTFMATNVHVKNQAYSILSRVQPVLHPRQYVLFHDIFMDFFSKKIDIRTQTQQDLTDFLRDIVPKHAAWILSFEGISLVLQETEKNYKKKMLIHKKNTQKLQQSYENWRKIHTQPFPLPRKLFESYIKLERIFQTQQICYHKSITNLRDAQKIYMLVQQIADFYGCVPDTWTEYIPKQESLF